MGIYNSESQYLIIPEVDVDGERFYDDVTLKLDFATRTFKVVGADEKTDEISDTPLATMEEEDIKMQFMGCARSGRNEVTCHIILTSLGGFDRYTVAGTRANSLAKSYLYDNLDNTHEGAEVTVANMKDEFLVKTTLIAGVPTLAKFKFKNISPKATSISLFEPGFYNGETKFKGDFRDIDF